MTLDLGLAARIDNTLLRPDATAREVELMCEESLRLSCHAACVAPCHALRAAAALRGGAARLAVAIAFPHGTSTTASKVFEAERAVRDGADELDVVANLGWIREGVWAELRREVATLCQAVPGVPLKVILEVAWFAPAEVGAAAVAACDGGAAFVKTSSGFGPRGVAVEDVACLRAAVGARVGIKAAGGIRTRALALALVGAGADRLGTSAAALLIEGEASA